MKFHVLAFAIFTAIGISLPAFAETGTTSERLAAAHELLLASHDDVIVNTRIDVIVRNEADQFKKLNPEVTNDDLAQYRSFLRAELTRTSVVLELTKEQYYADHLTLAEIKTWTVFVRSDVGQKICGIVPKMTSDLADADYSWQTTAIEHAGEMLGFSKTHRAVKP